jgi:hypothetical protein
MPDQLERVERRLRQVEEGLACALRRLDAIERPALAPEIYARTPTVIETPSREGAAPHDRLSLLPLAGRTFIVLGGAYFLRALTETGRVGVRGGVALGFIYAIVWFVVADRTGVRRRASSVVHGFAGALIGLPLLWEAAARFHVLNAQSSVLALAGWTGAALVVAWHRRLQSLAALGVAGAIGTALLLAVATGSFAPFALFLTLLSLATWWLSAAATWPWLRWPAAAAADLLVAGLILRAAAVPSLEAPSSALLAVAVLMFGSLKAFAWKSIVRREPIALFEIAQTSGVIALGVIGRVTLAARLDLSNWPAIVWLGSGLIAYVGAAVVVRRPHASSITGHYFASVGFVMMLTGAWVLVPAARIDACLAASALAYLWFGARVVHPVLAIQGALLALLAAVHSGLLSYAAAVWGIHAGSPGRFPAWLALAVAVAGLVPLLLSRPLNQRGVALIARLLLACVVVGAAATLGAGLIGAKLAHRSPGLAAASSTIVLTGVVALLVLASRSPRGREFAWLTYPVCAAGAVKLLLVDFAASGASTMFLSLAAYGLALTMAATQIKRRDGGA